MIRLFGVCTAVAVLQSTAAAAATLTAQGTFGGSIYSYYEFEPGDVMDYQTLIGSTDLAVITSAAEQAFVASLARTGGVDYNAWIGLNDIASEGDYEWIDGSPFADENWASGEPNNNTYDGGTLDEDSVMMAFEPAFEQFFGAGAWIDVPVDGRFVGGYLTEMAAVPVPTSFALLLGGLGALGLSARRRGRQRSGA